MRHPAFLRPEFYSGRNERHDTIPDITWLTDAPEPAHWAPGRRTLALLIDGNKSEIDADRDDNDILMMLNASEKPVLFTLAPVPQGKEAWYRSIDTALPSPLDIAAHATEERIEQETHRLEARSMVVMISR
jgi:glycogen operon protein